MSEPVEFDSSIPSNLSAGLALQEQIVQQMERFAYSMRDFLTEHGVSVEDYERWIAGLEEGDREGSYSYCVTTFAYLLER